MEIKVLVQGEPDTKPFTQIFHYEKSDEVIFVESTQLIKRHLSNNMRLNMNETLRLFVAFIATSLKEGKTISEIQKHIPDLLSSHQVMIGVPESLRNLTFTITIDNTNKKLMSVTIPICINQYLLYEGKQST